MTATREHLRDFARKILRSVDLGLLTGPKAADAAQWVRDHVPPPTARGTRPAAARATDRDTAHDAAATVRTGELESKVLEALRICPGGATTHALAQMAGIPLVSVSPRMAVLERAGLVRDSGERRQTTPGHSGIVWVAVPQAVSA